ncbi:MAG: biopolymer transporter ExbD [Treponema sp.]|nr:biopolymer transporter ExbD [Treponema sp.]
MKLRRRRSAFEDSSASSDIAFLLIIYFIVIAGFNVNRGFIMNLPAKDSTRLILKDELLRLELDESGVLWHAGETLSFATAETEIRTAIDIHPNLAVVLSIAPAAPWQQVVSFVELAQKLRVESFSFSMREL